MMLAVKGYIEMKALSYNEFALQLGVTRSHVSHLIAGDRCPSVPLLRKIHEVTGISLKTLIYECTA